MGYFLSALLLFFLNYPAAADTYQCSDHPNITYHSEQLELKPTKAQQLYFQLINISQQPLYLNKVIAHPSASAGWGTILEPNHFAIIALDQANFILSCVISNQQLSTVVNCKKVLHVCQIDTKLFRDGQPAPKGNYWLIENQAL